MWANDISDQDPRAVIQRVLLLFLSCRNKSRYLSGVKLRCSKPHELILALDKSGITRDNFIPAIELIELIPMFPEVRNVFGNTSVS